MSRPLAAFRIALAGPVPPPHGGMANQTALLLRLLRADGVRVTHVVTNSPYRPAWIGSVPRLRAVARRLDYGRALARALPGSDLLHVMANSGWSWHLVAAPAIRAACRRGIPVVVNYRGGGAERFLEEAIGAVRPSLERARALVVPSPFLERVFRRFGFAPLVVPNLLDEERFPPRPEEPAGRGALEAPHVLVARNLEPVYDVGTALRAFRFARERLPGARLTVAGSGPERAALEAEARELGLGDAVRFTGALENEAMAALYREADFVVNPSRVDNMPISLLEALAVGVPVISTRAGGIPDFVRDGEEAALVPVGDAPAIAEAMVSLARDPERRKRLVTGGRRRVEEFRWAHVRERWHAVYASVLPAASPP